MLSENIFAACANLISPVLTVYVNTAPLDAARHPRVRADVDWLLDEAQTLRKNLSHRDGIQFKRRVQRVYRLLEQRHAAERAVVIFLDAKTLRVVPLHVPVANGLYWGEAKIDRLLRLLSAHRRYGVVVIDHAGVRYFELAYGELYLLNRKEFEIDASQWKRKEQGRVEGERLQKSRGSLRDLYERRIEAQYRRLCHQVAVETGVIAKRHQFDGLFLIGPDRLTHAVRERITYPLAAMTVVVKENLGRSSPRQLERRLQPLAEHYEEEQQLNAVTLLQTSDRGVVTNPDEVIAQVQNGGIRSVLVAQDLELALRQCPKCGLASRAADRLCADCGEQRKEIPLGELLARVVAAGNVKIEFVNGRAAELLLRTGGLGGWVRILRAAAAS